MTGDLLRSSVGGVEWRVAVGGIRFDDRDDLVRIAAEVGNANAVRGMENLDRRAMRRQRSPVVDVVHALHLAGLPRVHFENHPIGQV